MPGGPTFHAGRRLWATFALLTLLAGCAAPDVARVPVEKPLGYELRPTGIGVPGSPQEVSFDRVDPGATRALAKLAGPVVNEEPCASGKTAKSFSAGLVAVFRGTAFVGWRDGERITGESC